MKQYITEEQWFEITNRQRADFLRAIGEGDEHIIGIGMLLPLPDIGKMIAFLHSLDDDELAFRLHLLIHEGKRETGNKWSFDADALVSTLWEGVKTVFMRQHEDDSR